jgi:uncharacterized protein (DUF885 family)
MEVKLHSSSLADLCNEVYDLQITHSPADAAAVGAPGSDRQFPDVVNTFQHDVPLDPARREALACAYRKYAAKFLELLPVAQDRSGPPVMDARGSFTDIANDSPLLTRELSIVVNMHEALRMRLDLLKHNTDWMRPVDQTSTSTPQLLADDLAGKGRFPIRSQEDLDAALERMQGWGPWVTQAVLNMQEGVRTGNAQSQAVLRAALRRQEYLLKSGVLRTLIASSLKNVHGVSDEAGNDYIDRMTALAGDGYFRLSDAIRSLLPKSRPNSQPGLCHLPNGEAEYSTLLHYWYGSQVMDMQAFQAEMRAGYEKTVEQLAAIVRGGSHGSVSSLIKFMHEDPSMMPFRSVQDIAKHLAEHRDLIVQNGGKLVKMAPEDLWYDIHVIGTGQLTDSQIYAPSNEQRKGAVYVHVGDPTKFRLPTAILHSIHEGFGHLMPLTLQQRLSADETFDGAMVRPIAIPFLQTFAPKPGFREGYAMYVERFAEELGFRMDDYARAEYWKRRMNCFRGMLLDIGMHYSGWSLKYAGEVRRKMNGNDGRDSSIEDRLRFAAWAGQVAAYNNESTFASCFERVLRGASDVELRRFNTALLREGEGTRLDITMRAILWRVLHSYRG